MSDPTLADVEKLARKLCATLQCGADGDTIVIVPDRLLRVDTPIGVVAVMPTEPLQKFPLWQCYWAIAKEALIATGGGQ